MLTGKHSSEFLYLLSIQLRMILYFEHQINHYLLVICVFSKKILIIERLEAQLKACHCSFAFTKLRVRILFLNNSIFVEQFCKSILSSCCFY